MAIAALVGVGLSLAACSTAGTAAKPASVGVVGHCPSGYYPIQGRPKLCELEIGQAAPGRPRMIEEGSTPSSLIVPAVVGEDQGAAQILIGLGLRVSVEKVSSTFVPVGAVFSQVPAAGARVPRGSTVTVMVSSGAS